NPAGTKFSGKLTGAGSLTMASGSTGTLIVSGTTSDYSGGTTLLGGTLDLRSNQALGANAGTVTLTGGTVVAGASVTLGNLLAVNGPVTFRGGSNTLTFNGATTLSGAAALTVNNTTTLAGKVSGAAPLVVQGGQGTLVLS